MKENSAHILVEMRQRQINNRVQKKEINLGLIGLFLWHISHCMLFNVKFIMTYYIKKYGPLA